MFRTLKRLLALANTPAPEPVAAARPFTVTQAMLDKGAQKSINTVIRKPLQAPALPPMPKSDLPELAMDDVAALGAAMAFDDSSMSAVTGWANSMGTFGCGLYFPGYPYLAELMQRPEYRIPSATIAAEMTRKWIKFKSIGKGDKSDDIEQIEAWFKAKRVQEHFRKAATLDGAFGRGQIFIDIAGQKDKRYLPLVIDSATVKKGSVLGFKVIEPMWTSPLVWNSLDPTAADFYSPTSWLVNGIRIHSSRFITFISREVPDLLKPSYNFSGISLTQMMENYVNQWLRTKDSVSDLIRNFSIMVLKTDMSAVLANNADGSSILNRAAYFRQTRDNQGLMMLDMTAEDLVKVEATLASLDKLQAQAQEHMAAVAQMPLVKLTGVTPSGLNASSEGEIQVWYDHLVSRQESEYTEPLNLVLALCQLDLFGKVDDAIGFEYVPLTEPNGKELSEIRKSDGDAGVAYINSGVISPDEERERLMADPMSGYNNLVGDAPEPPMEETDPNNPDGEQDDGEELEGFGADAAFEESKHPRKNDGKFGSGGGGASGSENKPKKKLTPNEKSTLSSYSGDNFLRVNAALRDGDDSGPEIERLDAAIAKGTVEPGTTLYRGMSKDAAKALLGGKEIKPGSVISDKAYASTSKDQGEAGARSLGGVVLKITAGKNAAGLDVGEHASNQSEQEVLLPRNAKMTVHKITQKKDSPGAPVVIHVTYGDADGDGEA
jgi:hypothetical protein